jgi:hypothetical protein
MGNLMHEFTVVSAYTSSRIKEEVLAWTRLLAKVHRGELELQVELFFDNESRQGRENL